MKVREYDIPAYVAAAAKLHDLALDGTRRIEVERQFLILTSMAQQFLDLPLSTDTEPATTYRP